MLHDRPHRRTHAFTLLELLSVMAILLILSGLAFGMIRGTKQRANLARTKAELSHLVQALEEYKRHYGDYPQTGASLANSQKVTGTAGPGPDPIAVQAHGETGLQDLGIGEPRIGHVRLHRAGAVGKPGQRHRGAAR